MPENNKLQNSQWTEQHDAFCLENKLTPAAKLLWQWLIRQGMGEEIEPDLKEEFNHWVEKHRGKPYHRDTLKEALQQLINCRVVQLVKKFKWHIVRIITRPLDWLKPRKNSPKRNQNCDSPPSNPQSAEQGFSSSSNTSFSEDQLLIMESVLSECEKEGIVFDPVQSPEILEYSLEEVQYALALFKNRGGHQTDYRGKPRIRNPQGWLLTCLRKCWYRQADQWSFGGLLAALGFDL
ncbi:hypothetical protein [Halotia branconii]|uniref:Uncharacterized protein n=1 Tax=Halotia branconii CENA392 TaxID=1539056 RepID=A0AAJ6NMX8_9CYAN|nr:hypothetical protein [Halotia branconii]WGV23361.1 hypothetical protein QI031_16165 [Halotia branconii CENA392]